MPEIEKYIEKRCRYCLFYKLPVPAPPFCDYFKKPFKNPFGWAKGNGTMPGDRGKDCKFFKNKKFIDKMLKMDLK